MRILHVGETVQGGVGTHINELVPLQAVMYGPSNIVILIPREHRNHFSRIEDAMIQTFSRPNRKIGLLHLLRAYIAAVRSHRPDIVHAHSTFAGILTRLLQPVFGVPVIYCPHGWAMDMDQSFVRKKVIGFVEYLLSFFSARIIVVSEREMKTALGIGISPDKIVKVFNGIAPEPPTIAPATWDDKRLKVLFVGRLDRQKGADILLEAVAELQDKVSVRVIGDSVANDTVMNFGANPHVQPLGWKSLDEVAAQMKACDVLVMPSRWEGLPIVAIEAMRVSKPIFASSVGGIPEVVADGVTGRLFASGDATALRNLLQEADKTVLTALGQAGYHRFLNLFVADKMANAVDAVYHNCEAA